MAMLDGAPLRQVTKVERESPFSPKATLTLSCGHSEVIDDFPLGTPPPCFRRYCNECGADGR